MRPTADPAALMFINGSARRVKRMRTGRLARWLARKGHNPMHVARFEDLQAEFLARVSRAVYCTMATIDRQNRPRSRIMHPIWEGTIGWVISWPGSHKAKHLAHNPAVSLAYIPDKEQPVYVDGIAEWIDTAEEKQRIWDLHATTPPPLGFDPQPHYGSIDHPYYGVLRITPWRIELGNLSGEPLIWRRPEER